MTSHASALPAGIRWVIYFKQSGTIIAHLSLALLYVNLVAKDNKWKILWVMGTCLNQKLVSPAVQCLERL
jgi:hypothetical protein